MHWTLESCIVKIGVDVLSTRCTGGVLDAPGPNLVATVGLRLMKSMHMAIAVEKGWEGGKRAVPYVLNSPTVQNVHQTGWVVLREARAWNNIRDTIFTVHAFGCRGKERNRGRLGIPNLIENSNFVTRGSLGAWDTNIPTPLHQKTWPLLVLSII